VRDIHRLAGFASAHAAASRSNNAFGAISSIASAMVQASEMLFPSARISVGLESSAATNAGLGNRALECDALHAMGKTLDRRKFRGQAMVQFISRPSAVLLSTIRATLVRAKQLKTSSRQGYYPPNLPKWELVQSG
jgi:hypothetical protein